jgi:hypothetical protein
MRKFQFIVSFGVLSTLVAQATPPVHARVREPHGDSPAEPPQGGAVKDGDPSFSVPVQNSSVESVMNCDNSGTAPALFQVHNDLLAKAQRDHRSPRVWTDKDLKALRGTLKGTEANGGTVPMTRIVELRQNLSARANATRNTFADGLIDVPVGQDSFMLAFITNFVAIGKTPTMTVKLADGSGELKLTRGTVRTKDGQFIVQKTCKRGK